MPLLFISHSANDVDLARALVLLFEKSLKLSVNEIRCTSVDGYGLPVGAGINSQIRTEVHDSTAFIGLITPASLGSPYVLFELGARWGADKTLAPVVAKGIRVSDLKAPLSELNALDISERNQVIKLAEDISRHLEVPLEPASSFQDFVDAVAVEARRASSAVIRDSTYAERGGLSDGEIEVLGFLAEVKQATPKQVAFQLDIKGAKADYYLDRLHDSGMIGWIGYDDESFFFIEQPGRAELVKRGLL